MPSNVKADNQYYGKLFESAIVAQINKEDLIYKENYEFSEEDLKQIMEEAKIVADYLGDNKADYIGDKTSTASGDILLNDCEVIEIKRVSAGSGTYFNTSVHYFSKFGFNFNDYMSRFGLYDALEENFGQKVRISRTNKSPVSQPNSSLIRHNFSSLYEEKILPIDTKMRKAFVEDLAKYFTVNIESLNQFVNDMLNKATDSSSKTAPDRLIVFNYNKGRVNEIDLTKYANQELTITATDKGIVIGALRIAIGWQNGNGLNNPTIRVFLEEV